MRFRLDDVVLIPAHLRYVGYSAKPPQVLMILCDKRRSEGTRFLRIDEPSGGQTAGSTGSPREQAS